MPLVPPSVATVGTAVAGPVAAKTPPNDPLFLTDLRVPSVSLVASTSTKSEPAEAIWAWVVLESKPPRARAAVTAGRALSFQSASDRE